MWHLGPEYFRQQLPQMISCSTWATRTTIPRLCFRDSTIRTKRPTACNFVATCWWARWFWKNIRCIRNIGRFILSASVGYTFMQARSFIPIVLLIKVAILSNDEKSKVEISGWYLILSSSLTFKQLKNASTLKERCFWTNWAADLR